MTAIAALVAEALAHAEKVTDYTTGGACRYAALPTGHLEAEPRDGEFDDIGWMGEHSLARDNADTVPVARLDVVDAALAHLATRAAEAEGRAERAEARVRDFVTTILDYGYSEADGLGYVVVGDGDDPDDLPNLIEYARQIRKEDAEKEAPHG